MAHKHKSRYLYVGCFVSPNDLEDILKHVGGKRLANVVVDPHVTLDFEPDNAYEECFGMPVTWKVVGYANDGLNEGILLQPVHADENMVPVLARRAKHHMTLSYADGAHAKDTNLLEFEPLNPIEVTTTFGACTYQGAVVVKRAKPSLTTM